MRIYPQFLKTYPKLYGMSFQEIGLMVLVLYVSFFTNLQMYIGIPFATVAVMTFRYLNRNYDLKSFLLPRIKEYCFDSKLWRDNEPSV